MAGVWTTLKIKDALGATLNMLAWDESGTGIGPWSYGHMFATGTSIPPANLAGDVANDAVDSGNPIKLGGVARSSEATAVSASGDRVNGVFDLVRKQIVLPYGHTQ